MRTLITASALLLAFSIGQVSLLACGDKFFLVGRGDRFSRTYASLNPGNIVIYTGGNGDVSKALADVRLQKQFKSAGHHVQVAGDSSSLSKALQAGSVDIVLASLDEALLLVPGVNASTSKPTLMPVEGRDRGRPGTAPHQFTATLKASDRVTGFLAKIDEAMKARTTQARGRS